MKYGITDLAGMLGITTSAIRYFEKEHLIQVEKEKTGGVFMMKLMCSGFYLI